MRRCPPFFPIFVAGWYIVATAGHVWSAWLEEASWLHSVHACKYSEHSERSLNVQPLPPKKPNDTRNSRCFGPPDGPPDGLRMPGDRSIHLRQRTTGGSKGPRIEGPVHCVMSNSFITSVRVFRFDLPYLGPYWGVPMG